MLKKLFPLFKSGDAYAYQGMRQYAIGNYLQAIENYYKALDRKLKVYDDYEIYAKIGFCYWQLHLFEKSIDTYKKSIAINPNYHKSWSELGVF
jgi:tetratricopeptide (TPR) repeat protein